MDHISDTRKCMASAAIFKSLYDEKKDLYSVIASAPCGPIPHNMAKTFDGPPTLERSGSEHRVGRFPSSSLRGEDRDERWSLL